MHKAVQTPPVTQAGTLEEALANGRQLLRDRPDMALAQALAILKRDGRNPGAYRLAAAAHRALGEKENAERAELAAIHHSQQVPALVAATKALDDGEPGEASRLAAAHLTLVPDDLAAITISAESALALGLPAKAEPLLRIVVKRAPAFLAAITLLINALMRQDKLVESRQLVEAILALRPSDESTLRTLATIHAGLGDQAGAARTYELLLKMADRSADTWLLYGDTLRFLGRQLESGLAYRRALALDRHFGKAWWALVNLDPAAVSDDEIAEMKEALAARADQPEHTSNLHFALGSALDACGRHKEAFDQFEAGNRLRRAAQPHDARAFSQKIDRHIDNLGAGALPRPGDRAHHGPVPIFIVGMPRSGSTLVERILGRHSQIDALGELPMIPHIVEALKLEHPASPLEPRIASLSAERLASLATNYLDRVTERRRSEKAYFTDKLHMNWRHLPLILRMFPDARVIDVRRSALDCCWSNYKLLARGHPAAADLGDLGRFFTDYVRLMDHIEAIAPKRVHRLRYEALVDDIESETGEMLDYLGVPFEADVLDFHLSSEPIATASSEQVRQPLNRRGIGSWRPYDPWLGPLREALGPLADG